MKTLKKRENRLNELLDDVILNDQSARRSREVFNNLVCTNPSLILEIIGRSKVHDAWISALERRNKELVRGQVKAEVLAQGRTTDLRVVSGYVQRQPPRSNLGMTIVADMTALVFRIDGDDLRQWSIGRCKTAAKRKNKESRILQCLADSYGHLGDEKIVGDLCSDDVLRQIIDRS